MEAESNHLGAENTACESFDERTPDIIPETNIQAIHSKESLNSGKQVLHPGERVK